MEAPTYSLYFFLRMEYIVLESLCNLFMLCVAYTLIAVKVCACNYCQSSQVYNYRLFCFMANAIR